MRKIHIPELSTTEGVRETAGIEIHNRLSQCSTRSLLDLLIFISGHSPDALSAAIRFINPEPFTVRGEPRVPSLLH